MAPCRGPSNRLTVNHASATEQVAMEAIIVAEERAERAEHLARSYRDALYAQEREEDAEAKSESLKGDYASRIEHFDEKELEQPEHETEIQMLKSSRLAAERSSNSADRLLKEAARLRKDKEQVGATLDSLKSGFESLVEKFKNVENQGRAGRDEAANKAVSPSKISQKRKGNSQDIVSDEGADSFDRSRNARESRAVSHAIVSTAAAAEARIRSAERRASMLEDRISAQPITESAVSAVTITTQPRTTTSTQCSSVNTDTGTLTAGKLETESLFEVEKLRLALREESLVRGELEAKLLALGQDLLKLRHEQQELRNSESKGPIGPPVEARQESSNNAAKRDGPPLSSEMSRRLSGEITTLMNRVVELESALANTQAAKTKEADRSSSLRKMLGVLQASKEAYASQVERLRQEHLSNQSARSDMELTLRRLSAGHESMRVNVGDLASAIRENANVDVTDPASAPILSLASSMTVETRTCGTVTEFDTRGETLQNSTNSAVHGKKSQIQEQLESEKAELARRNEELTALLQEAESKLQGADKVSLARQELKSQMNKLAGRNQELTVSLQEAESKVQAEVERARCLDIQLTALTSEGFSSTVELGRNVEKMKQLQDDLEQTQVSLVEETAARESSKQELIVSLERIAEVENELAELEGNLRSQRESGEIKESENKRKEQVIQMMREAAKIAAADNKLMQENLEKARSRQNELEAEVASLREIQEIQAKAKARENELEVKVKSLQETITRMGEDAADSADAADASDVARREVMVAAIAEAVENTRKEMSLEKEEAVESALSQVEDAVSDAVSASEGAAEVALGLALAKIRGEVSQREKELKRRAAESEGQVATLMKQGEDTSGELKAMLNRFEKLAEEHRVLVETMQQSRVREDQVISSMKRVEQEKRELLERTAMERESQKVRLLTAQRELERSQMKVKELQSQQSLQSGKAESTKTAMVTTKSTSAETPLHDANESDASDSSMDAVSVESASLESIRDLERRRVKLHEDVRSLETEMVRMRQENTEAATLATSVAHAEILKLDTEIMERQRQLTVLNNNVMGMEKKMAAVEQIKTELSHEEAGESKQGKEDDEIDAGETASTTMVVEMTSLTRILSIPSTFESGKVDEKQQTPAAAEAAKEVPSAAAADAARVSSQAYSQLQGRCAEMKASLSTLRQQVAAMNSGSDGVLQAAIMQLQLQRATAAPSESRMLNLPAPNVHAVSVSTSTSEMDLPSTSIETRETGSDPLSISVISVEDEEGGEEKDNDLEKRDAVEARPVRSLSAISSEARTLGTIRGEILAAQARLELINSQIAEREQRRKKLLHEAAVVENRLNQSRKESDDINTSILSQTLNLSRQSEVIDDDSVGAFNVSVVGSDDERQTSSSSKLNASDASAVPPEAVSMTEPVSMAEPAAQVTATVEAAAIAAVDAVDAADATAAAKVLLMQLTSLREQVEERRQAVFNATAEADEVELRLAELREETARMERAILSKSGVKTAVSSTNTSADFSGGDSVVVAVASKVSVGTSSPPATVADASVQVSCSSASSVASLIESERSTSSAATQAEPNQRSVATDSGVRMSSMSTSTSIDFSAGESIGVAAEMQASQSTPTAVVSTAGNDAAAPGHGTDPGSPAKYGKFISHSRELQDSLAITVEQLSAKNEELLTLQSELSSTNDSVTLTTGQLSAKKDELSSLNSELSSARGSVATTIEQLSMQKEELSLVQSELASARDTVATTTEQLSNQKEELSTVQSELASARDSVAMTMEQLVTNKEELSMVQSELRSSHSALSRLIHDVDSARSDLGNTIARKEQIAGQVKHQKTLAAENRSQLEETVRDLKERVHEAKEELARVVSAAESKRKELGRLTAELLAEETGSTGTQARILQMKAELERAIGRMTNVKAAKETADATLRDIKERVEQEQAALDQARDGVTRWEEELRKAKTKHSQVMKEERERIDADRARSDMERAASVAREKVLHDSEVERRRQNLKGIEEEVRRARDEKLAEEAAVENAKEQLRCAMDEKEIVQRAIEDAEAERRRTRDAVEEEEAALIRAKKAFARGRGQSASST